jgi:hypothetical protein
MSQISEVLVVMMETIFQEIVNYCRLEDFLSLLDKIYESLAIGYLKRSVLGFFSQKHKFQRLYVNLNDEFDFSI